MWILLLWIAGCATRPPPPAADPHAPPQEVQEALEPVLQRAATRCGPNDVGKNPEDLLSEEERTLIALHGRWTKPKLRALWDKGYVHAGVMLMKIGERDLGRRAKELWFADDRYYVREDTWRLAWPCRRLLERAATSSSVNGWRMRLTDEEKALVRANPTRPNINALVRAGNSTWMQIWANQDMAAHGVPTDPQSWSKLLIEEMKDQQRFGELEWVRGDGERMYAPVKDTRFALMWTRIPNVIERAEKRQFAWIRYSGLDDDVETRLTDILGPALDETYLRACGEGDVQVVYDHFRLPRDEALLREHAFRLHEPLERALQAGNIDAVHMLAFLGDHGSGPSIRAYREAAADPLCRAAAGRALEVLGW